MNIWNEFKDDCVQKQNAELEERNTVATVTHGDGGLMILGCLASSGMGNIEVINGIMKTPTPNPNFKPIQHLLGHLESKLRKRSF
ncbi:unnamed protein product [Ceratitis capitata]|uniref:(Mediterranean fruit fly) hypothetical protein n=1 Tax=Ceratitis capitata TaxID=7213 RepID=A0A811UNG7_CERCA|nr:unnamed protein product [Ceratitis capitata]